MNAKNVNSFPFFFSLWLQRLFECQSNEEEKKEKNTKLKSQEMFGFRKWKMVRQRIEQMAKITTPKNTADRYAQWNERRKSHIPNSQAKNVQPNKKERIEKKAHTKATLTTVRERKTGFGLVYFRCAIWYIAACTFKTTHKMR